LSTLPGDYDLKLLNSAGTQVGISENGSTTSETISYTATAGTYHAQVYGYNGANNSTSCYTLKVALGTATRNIGEQPITGRGVIKVYPNPANNTVNISVLGIVSNRSTFIEIVDAKGAVLQTNRIGSSTQAVNISRLPKGAYLLRVNDGSGVITSRFIKQ
jgi:hypothetical protein